MRNTIIAVAIAALASLLGPSLAAAEEYQIGMQSHIEYDSNIFNSDSDPTDDFVVRVGPILGMRRSQGAIVYDLRYEPRWEHFLQGTAEDAWDHNAFGRVSWQLTPRTIVAASNRFLYTRSLNRAGFIVDPGTPDAVPVTDVEVARQRITRNVATVDLTHDFSGRLQGSLNGSYSLFRTDRADRVDSDSVSTTATLGYLVRPTDRVGGGVGFTWSGFEDTPTLPGSDTYYYRLFATWFHQFSPTFTLSVQGGPTFIQTTTTSNLPQAAIVPALPSQATETGGVRTIDSRTCPTADDGQPVLSEECGLFPTELTGPAQAFVRSTAIEVFQVDSDSDPGVKPTFFGSVELVKSWEHWRAIFNYTRTDSTVSGVGQATTLDFVNGTIIWSPTDRWEALVGASWSQRNSSTDQLVNAVGLGPPGLFLFSPTVVVQGSPAINLRAVEADNFTDIQTYTARFRVTRTIGRSSQVFMNFVYFHQMSSGATLERSFDNYRVLIGFKLLTDWARLL